MKLQTAKLNILKATKEADKLYTKIKPSLDSITAEASPKTVESISSVRAIIQQFITSVEDLSDLAGATDEALEELLIEESDRVRPINIVKDWLFSQGYKHALEEISLDNSIEQLVYQLKGVLPVKGHK